MANHFDPVHAPAHYTSGSIECIEAIEAQLTPEEYRGFLKGNVAKYLWREKMKGGTQSLEKAQWYLNALIQIDQERNSLSQCKDGFCPMPDVRHDSPLPVTLGDDKEMFPPVSAA